MMEKIDVVGYE